MEFIQAIFPGFALAFAILLLALGASQLYIHQKAGYIRSRQVAQFCFTAAAFCVFHFVLHSRHYTQEFLLNFNMFVFLLIPVGRYNYFKSMSYFVAISNRYYDAYMVSNSIVGTLCVIPVLSELVGGPNLIYDPAVKEATGNFFVDSFALVFGKPQPFLLLIMGVFSFLDVFFAVYLLRKIMKSSRDFWLSMGMCLTIFSATFEYILLTFTTSYYVPVYIISNTFEAGRMSFLAFKEYLLESELKGSQLQPVKDSTPFHKYQNINLTDEKAKELSLRLEEILSKSEVYSDSNLRLEKLAYYVGAPAYLLSQVINSSMDTNFYDLINRYRIEAVKRKLLDEKYRNKNILEIAYSSGFNSKSTFYTSFKKVAGQTPAEFRSQNKNA